MTIEILTTAAMAEMKSGQIYAKDTKKNSFLGSWSKINNWPDSISCWWPTNVLTWKLFTRMQSEPTPGKSMPVPHFVAEVITCHNDQHGGYRPHKQILPGMGLREKFYESALDRLLFDGSDLFLQQPDSICEEWGLHRKWQGLEEVVWMTTLLGQKAISWYCAFFQYGLNASGTGLPECWPSGLNYQPLQSFRHSHSFVSS